MDHRSRHVAIISIQCLFLLTCGPFRSRQDPCDQPAEPKPSWTKQAELDTSSLKGSHSNGRVFVGSNSSPDREASLRNAERAALIRFLSSIGIKVTSESYIEHKQSNSVYTFKGSAVGSSRTPDLEIRGAKHHKTPWRAYHRDHEDACFIDTTVAMEIPSAEIKRLRSLVNNCSHMLQDYAGKLFKRRATRFVVIAFYGGNLVPEDWKRHWADLVEKHRAHGTYFIAIEMPDEDGHCNSPHWIECDRQICDNYNDYSSSGNLAGGDVVLFSWKHRDPLLSHAVPEQVDKWLSRAAAKAWNIKIHDVVDVSGRSLDIKLNQKLKSIVANELFEYTRYLIHLKRKLPSHIRAGSNTSASIRIKRTKNSIDIEFEPRNPDQSAYSLSASVPLGQTIGEVEATQQAAAVFRERLLEMDGVDIRSKQDVKIETDPVGAVVLIDGKEACARAPCVATVESLDFELELRLKGYLPYKERATRKVGSKVIRLSPMHAVLSVFSEPSDIDVYLDDVVIGKTPISGRSTTAGEHLIRIGGELFEHNVKRLILAKGQSKELYSEAKIKSGVLVVNGDIDGRGFVFVDGEEAATTGEPFEARVGVREIRVQHPVIAGRRFSGVKRVSVQEGRRKEVIVPLTSTNVTPSGAVRIPVSESFTGLSRKHRSIVSEHIRRSGNPAEKGALSIFEKLRMTKVGGFRIDKHEVTVRSYRLCVRVNRCRPPVVPPELTSKCNYFKPSAGDHPMNCVGWQEAKEYCSYVKGRLPRSAEWERSARGTRGRLYPWGTQYPHTGFAAWKGDSSPVEGSVDQGASRPQTREVCSFPSGKSVYGLCDMAGNVLEWVEDTVVSATGEEKKQLKGGSFYTANPMYMLPSYFSTARPDSALATAGFRCVYPAE
jgi:hypothetical protein